MNYCDNDRIERVMHFLLIEAEPSQISLYILNNSSVKGRLGMVLGQDLSFPNNSSFSQLWIYPITIII